MRKHHIENTDKGLCLDVHVTWPLGLHARPAARIAKVIEDFSVDVFVLCGENSADGKSMLDLLTLGAVEGSQLFFYAKGDNAQPCLLHIAELFSTEFKR